MPRRCVFGCSPTRLIHSFPNPKKFPEQFKAWIKIISGKDVCNFDYTKKKVCYRHFTDKDWNRHNRLNALAVPSLYLNGYQEEADNQEGNDPQTEDAPAECNDIETSKIVDYEVILQNVVLQDVAVQCDEMSMSREEKRQREAVNEQIGAFVARELDALPDTKRRHIMRKILRLFDDN